MYLVRDACGHVRRNDCDLPHVHEFRDLFFSTRLGQSGEVVQGSDEDLVTGRFDADRDKVFPALGSGKDLELVCLGLDFRVEDHI